MHTSQDSTEHSCADVYLTTLILDYLAENPQASDTLHAIADWWVPRQQERVLVDQVARVLTRLTRRGMLEAVGNGVHCRYRLRPGVPVPARRS